MTIHCGLIAFILINNMGHLSMSVICFFDKMFVMSFDHFQLILLRLLSCESPLHILERSSLFGTSLENIFSLILTVFSFP